MAVVARTRGNESGISGEFFGRDIQFLKVTVSGAGKAAFATVTGPNCALAAIVNGVQRYSTVSIVGSPSGDDAVIAVEGLSSLGTASNLSLAANAALVSAGFTSGTAITATFVVYDKISGTTFAAS